MLPTESGSNIHATLAKFRPGLAFVVMIFGALIAFEIFNYTTTDHALRDLLGDLTFAGFIPWATVLALAFCGIDFAGIARLFTPEQGASEPKEVWYLFGAWLLAATMNAILTWWGVSMAVANHQVQSAAVVDQATLTGIVPVFVAIMVWVIRILIIGTLSLAMDRLLHSDAEQGNNNALQTAWNSRQVQQMPVQPTQRLNVPAGLSSASLSSRPAVNRSVAASSNKARFSRTHAPEDVEYVPETQGRGQPEPTYHTLAMGARPSVKNDGSPARQESSGTNRYRRS